MKRQIVILILFLIAINGHAQTHYYTILRVNESKLEKIYIGENEGILKGRGDTIPENNCRVHWSDERQSIEYLDSQDGNIYTVYASNYFKSTDKWKERYSYIKYNVTATKGNHKWHILYAFVKDSSILIDRIPVILGNNHKCYLKLLRQGTEYFFESRVSSRRAIVVDNLQGFQLLEETNSSDTSELIIEDSSSIEMTSLKVAIVLL